MMGYWVSATVPASEIWAPCHFQDKTVIVFGSNNVNYGCPIFTSALYVTPWFIPIAIPNITRNIISYQLSKSMLLS